MRSVHCHFKYSSYFIIQRWGWHSPNFLPLYFLIEGYLLYRILWFSVIHQQESAIGTPMSPPSPPHPSRLLGSLFEFPESHSKFPLAIYFTYGIVNFHVVLSMYLTFSLLPSPCVHRFVLYVYFLHCCPENKFISTIFLDSIYMHHYTIFVFFLKFFKF